MEITRTIKESFYRIRNKKKYRDVFFRLLFGEDKHALLELFNALNNSNYTDEKQLNVVTIENAIYISWKNDVAFMLSGVINLYEHQSTINPNMPVRMLIYLGQEYQKLISSTGNDIYGSKLVPLPAPKCVVFYNGDELMPEEKIYNLSDAYENKDIEPDADLRVRVININQGFNQDLVDKCETLSGYITIIQKVNEYKQDHDLEEAINMALEFCLKNNILTGFIRRNRAEVFGSLLTDFDWKKHERSRQEELMEAREESRQEGIQEGIQEGEIKAKHQNIIELLEEYGPVPIAIADKIKLVDNSTELSRLLKLAAKVSSIEEFARRMRRV